MTVAAHATNCYLDRPAPSSLADARIVVSVDTYLRFAEAVNRLDLTETQSSGLPELVEDLTESDQEGKGRGAIEAEPEKAPRVETTCCGVPGAARPPVLKRPNTGTETPMAVVQTVDAADD